MKKFRVALINKDDNRLFDVDFEASNLDEAWNKVAELCLQLNSVCENLQRI